MAFQDIRKSQKFLTPSDLVFILGAVLLMAALLALNIYLSRTLNGGEWLFLRWSGMRAFMFEQLEPYGSTIAQRVQLLVYGREAYLAEYPYVLNDPFYIVMLYAPLAWFFKDFAIAHGIWMLFSEMALIGIVLLLLSLSEWKPPTWLLTLLIVFGLFNYFSINSLLASSPAIFLTLIYLSILVALRSFSDELAGALLLLAAYQWEIGALFFIFILVFVFANRRWGVLIGLGMTLMVLAIVSFISNSGWVVSYARAALFDWQRGINYSFGLTLSYLFPTLSVSVGRWVAIIAGAILLLESIHSVNKNFRHLTWAALLSLTLNPLMGFAIFPANHIVLMPSLILIIALVWERWIAKRVVISIILLTLAVVFSFGFYFEPMFASAHLFSNLLKILPPVMTLVGLYWMRWWAVRPPRIWADQFGVRR